MVKQVGDASKEVKTLKVIRDSFKSDDISVVGFFDSDKDKEYETYINAGKLTSPII
jgi:hypothetical protein